MNVPDMGMVGRLARVCGCAEHADRPRGIAACSHFASVGFTDLPRNFVVDATNACCVGTLDSHVVLAFRGRLPLSFETKGALLHSLHAWHSDADLGLIRVNGIDGMVQRGFADALLQLWPLFMEEVQDRLSDGKKLIVTGHGKGGAVAALAACRLASMGLADAPHVCTFAAPCAGDFEFAYGFKERIQTAWRFEFRDDLAPHLPLRGLVASLLQEHDPRLRELRVPSLAPVGSLEFINGSGKVIASNGSWLEIERAGRLAYLLAEGRVEQLGADHSLEGAYLPAIGRLIAPACTFELAEAVR
jgi:hypothetical protein